MSYLLGLVLAFLAAIFWGVTNTLIKKAENEDNISPYTNVILVQVFMILIMSIFIYQNEFLIPSIEQMPIYILAGIFFTGSITFLYSALRDGYSSIVAAISNAGFLIVVPLSVLFYLEVVSFFQVLAILVTLVGMFLVSIDFSHLRKFEFDISVVKAFLAMVFWALGVFVLKSLVFDIGPFNTVFFISILILIFMSIFVIVRKKEVHLVKALESGTLVIAIFTQSFGTVSYYIAVALIPISIVSPVTSVLPIFSVVSAYFLLNERVKNYQYLGILLSIIGAVSIVFL